jgi:D-alanyl-D-alanine carboxypeptidase/D-alanyl-D-alanine-endopeptidase (penicillin-binding protein 4)
VVRRHPRAWAGGAALVAFLVLGGGAFAAGAAVGGGQPVALATVAPSSAAPTPAVTATPTPTVPSRPQPQAAVAPAAVRTCSIADLSTDPRLGTFLGSVRNASTGQVLFDRSADTYARTASVMKVLTSAAALAVLGPDYRIPTTVVKGTDPGQVVLVGGGDITLASGASNIYAGSASMLDLASQVQTAWDADPSTKGTPITSVVLDSTLFTGDSWHPSWARSEQYDGSSSYVTALQVDGDRADPDVEQSPRGDDPVAHAGQAFASALGMGAGASITDGTAPAGAATLGQVLSAPLSTMIPDMLQRSDNTAAEALDRLTAIQLGMPGSFDSLGTAIPKALATYGIDTSQLKIVDGSGLSDDNAVSPNYLSQLFIKINNGDGNLGVIADGLPVAGETGTLAGRFTGSDAVAAGNVMAKTGWIDTGYTLAGIIHAADGSTLTFAFFALDDVGDSTISAIDDITAGTYRCGDNLSNN